MNAGYVGSVVHWSYATSTGTATSIEPTFVPMAQLLLIVSAPNNANLVLRL
jgi:hypothetical protein